MELVLAYTLRLRPRKEIRGLGITVTTFRFHGIIRFDGSHLAIHWSGTEHVAEKYAFNVHSGTAIIPPDSVAVPVASLRSARLRGGWWLPAVELREQEPGALAGVPGGEQGRLSLAISRADRGAASDLVNAINRSLSASIGVEGAGAFPRSGAPPRYRMGSPTPERLGAGPALESRMEALEAEVNRLRAELAEALERLDFTERLLTRIENVRQADSPDQRGGLA